MKEEEILFLNQLVNTLEEVEKDLEKSYNKRNYDYFNRSKKIMFKIQEEISNIVK